MLQLVSNVSKAAALQDLRTASAQAVVFTLVCKWVARGLGLEHRDYVSTEHLNVTG